MRIQPHQDLTAALILREMYGPSRNASAHALRQAAKTRQITPAQVQFVQQPRPSVEAAELLNALVPAKWPYENPLKTSPISRPPDVVYEPHRIPEKFEPALPNPHNSHVRTTDRKGQWLDVFA